MAIVAANASAGADTINFLPGLDGLMALNAPLEISDTSGTTTIAGPGLTAVAVTGSQQLMLIDRGVSAVISGISFAGAQANPNAPQVLKHGSSWLQHAKI